VKKFVIDLRQVNGFLRVFRLPPAIKLTNDIAEILLKVALSTINQTKTINYIIFRRYP
jgi:hypothetical protein